MPNITDNRINTVVTDADGATILSALGTIETTFSFLIALTDDERGSLFSLDVNNKVFVEEALQEVQNDNGVGVLPSYLKAINLENDLTLFDQLDNFESKLLNILKKISDTKRLAAHEAYSTALTAYHLFEAAHEAGITNATQSYLRLKPRFQNQGGRPQSTPPTP